MISGLLLFLKLSFSRILKALGDVCEVAWRYPWQAALIASLCLSGALSWVIMSKNREIVSISEKYANLVEANKLATEYATAAKRKAEQRNKELNDEADKRSDDLRIVYRDRILWRTAKGNPASADLPGGEISQGADRSGEDSVCISRSDALIFTENQARLQSAHDWALGMEKK